MDVQAGCNSQSMPCCGHSAVVGDIAHRSLVALVSPPPQIARLRQLLVNKSVAEDTMLWYTADNGAASRERRHGVAVRATRG